MIVKPQDLVCNVLTEHPAAWPVFERHGMCEDCKASPPSVSVQHFVGKHCGGNIERFLQEINEAIGAN